MTNAFYINDDMIDCFIENQVSYVAVSFDGIGKIYESIRHPAKFRESYQKLTMLKNKKRKPILSYRRSECVRFGLLSRIIRRNITIK